ESDTFKTIPGYGDTSAHSLCFNCHWESQKPTKDECNGCHVARSDYISRPQIGPPRELSSNTLAWFKNWPADLPRRLSLKFRHNTNAFWRDGKTETNNHDLGCTTCHTNIAQLTTLNIKKADVQTPSCAPCHATTSAIPVSQNVRVTIFNEMTSKAD